MTKPLNIGLQPGTRALRLVRAPNTLHFDIEAIPQDIVYKVVPGHWIMWINTNDFINGTYLKLYDNGKIERVTVREDEPADDVQLIKPEDE